MKVVMCSDEEHNWDTIILPSVIYEKFIQCRKCWALVSSKSKNEISSIFTNPLPELIEVMIIKSSEYSYISGGLKIGRNDPLILRLIVFKEKKHLYKYRLITHPQWGMEQLKK